MNLSTPEQRCDTKEVINALKEHIEKENYYGIKKVLELILSCRKRISALLQDSNQKKVLEYAATKFVEIIRKKLEHYRNTSTLEQTGFPTLAEDLGLLQALAETFSEFPLNTLLSSLQSEAAAKLGITPRPPLSPEKMTQRQERMDERAKKLEEEASRWLESQKEAIQEAEKVLKHYLEGKVSKEKVEEALVGAEMKGTDRERIIEGMIQKLSSQRQEAAHQALEDFKIPAGLRKN